MKDIGSLQANEVVRDIRHTPPLSKTTRRILAAFEGNLPLHSDTNHAGPPIHGNIRPAKWIAPYFNYDKALIGLALIAFCVPVCRERSRWGAILKATLPWSLLVFVVVVSLAILIGYVRFDPKLPPEFFLWAWINLFFTCIPEEALFRGFVQQGLQDRLRDSRHGELIALTAASVLFGLAHFAGGLRYIFLATVAGFGYGWIYQRTGAIESSIVVHFMVNALHFVFFTYPALK